MSAARIALRYFADHWAGRQSFARSFWINLVALRLALVLLQGALIPASGGLGVDPLAAGAAILLTHGALFIWQAVGALRAAEAHIREGGALHLAWGAQLGVIIAVFVTLSTAWGAWQTTLPAPPDESFSARMDREHAARYQLIEDGPRLILRGEFALGVTRALRARLDERPATVIELESDGGNIYEARGVGALIRERGLDAEVRTRCSSACPLAFLGGRTRRMTRDAKIGFHQYRIDAGYAVLRADPAAEQARDDASMARAGVAPWFRARVFDRPPEDMWFPDAATLLRAGVVHAVME